MRRMIAVRSCSGYMSSTAAAVAAGSALIIAAAAWGGSFASAPRTFAGGIPCTAVAVRAILARSLSVRTSDATGAPAQRSEISAAKTTARVGKSGTIAPYASHHPSFLAVGSCANATDATSIVSPRRASMPSVAAESLSNLQNVDVSRRVDENCGGDA